MTQRIASVFALSGWAGFCAVSAVRCAHEAGLSEVLFGSFGADLLAGAQFPVLGVPQQDLVGLAAVLLALAIAFAVSIAGVLQLVSVQERIAEPFAAATFSALFGFYAALALSGSPAAAMFGEGPLVTLFIALGFVALLFDHIIADREDPEGDATFEAVMAHLEEAKRAAILERNRRDGNDPDNR